MSQLDTFLSTVADEEVVIQRLRRSHEGCQHRRSARVRQGDLTLHFSEAASAWRSAELSNGEHRSNREIEPWLRTQLDLSLFEDCTLDSGIYHFEATFSRRRDAYAFKDSIERLVMTISGR